MELSLQDIIGQGYNEVWFTNSLTLRYRIIKGARNTKKSVVIGSIEPLIKLLSDTRRNILMVRQNDSDNADSTYASLVSWIHRLSLDNIFRCYTTPLKIVRRQTGQVILFRGFNNPESLTSIKTQVGSLTDIYIEEASQLTDYESFRVLDGSLRDPDPTLHLQITFMLNPWDADSWINDKFCRNFPDDPEYLATHGYRVEIDPTFNLGYGKGLLIHTGTYKINEFRHPDYDEGMEQLREHEYSRYITEGLGCWGNTGNAVYPHPLLPLPPTTIFYPVEFSIGIDVGLSDGQGHITNRTLSLAQIKSATTMVLIAATTNYEKVLVLDEFFHTNINNPNPLTTTQIQTQLLHKIQEWRSRYPLFITRPPRIWVDNADKGFRETLEMLASRYGLYNMQFLASTKLPIINRIAVLNHLLAFEDIYFDLPNTPNIQREFKQAKRGDKGEPRKAGNDHTLDALDYALTPLMGKIKRLKDFKLPQ